MLNKLKENRNLILLMLFGFFTGFMFSTSQITDYDFWFHYTAGEHFVVNGQIPDIPIFSWYGIQENLPWISHEWLFGVIIYYLYELVGKAGLYLVAPTMLGLVIAFTIYLFRDVFKKNYALSIIGIFVVALIAKMGAAPRPQLFAYFLTTILFYILKKDSEEDCKAIWFLPILTIIWTNVHGGSYILIHAFLLLSVLMHLFDFRLGKIVFVRHERNRLYRRLIVLLLCVLVIPLNAHGFDMITYPLTNFGDKVMQSAISEWSSPDLKVSSHIKIYLMMAIGICSLITTKKDIKAIDMLTMFTYLFLTARSFRFALQMALVILPIALSYTDSVDNWLKLTKDKLVTFTLSFLIFILILGSGVTVVNRINDPINMKVFPSDEILEVVKETNPRKLLNGYNEGGYLIFKDVYVFIDGRADIYSRHNLSDYLTITNLRKNALELIEKYEFDYVLLMKTTPLCNYMKNSYDFELITEDDTYAYYRVAGDVFEENPKGEQK